MMHPVNTTIAKMQELCLPDIDCVMMELIGKYLMEIRKRMNVRIKIKTF